MASHAAASEAPQYASPATKMLVRRRQMIELQQQLAEQQAVYAGKDKELMEREAALRAKDREFQAHICRFSRFLQDNDAKCARAHKKGQEERRLQALRQRELGQLEADIASWKAKREELKAAAQQNVRFREYLESCLLEGFRDIPAIFGRHASLVAAAADLQLRQVQCQQALTAEQQELQAWTDMKSLHIESVSAAIAKLKGAAAAKATPDGLTAAAGM